MSPAVGDPTTEYEQQAPPQAADYGPKYRNLPDQIKNAILAAIRAVQSEEKYTRRDEVLEDAKHRFYDVGVQHLYLNRSWSWTMATPGGSYDLGPNQNVYFGDYIDDYPILPAYAQIQRAKLSEHDPGIDFQPDDPNEPDDTESAKAGEALRHDFDRNNDTKLLQQQMVYYWQMGGRCVAWTRSEEKPPRFGYDDGNPQRGTTATLYGCIEAKVPTFASTLADCGYAILYDDPDVKQAKAKYPWIKKRIQSGQTCLDENAYERIARLAIIQNSTGRLYNWNIGDSVTHLVSRGHCFLRHQNFVECDDPVEQPDPTDYVTDEDGDERVITVEEKIKKLYPSGVCAVVVGQEYAESWDASMDDCLSISHAFIGKGQTRMPMMRPMVVIQDRFNQMMNQIAESTDYRVAGTWISCTAAEFGTISKQRAKPGAFRNLKNLPPGADIRQYIYREDDYDIPGSFQKFIEYLQNLPQFQGAIPAAIWGAAMADNQTAQGYQLAAAQAMGILGSLWDMETQMFADIYYQNCLAIARDDQYPDQIVIPDIKGRRAVVEKASLTKGKFRCFPDKESGFPQSTASLRQAWERTFALIGQTPQGMAVFNESDNIEQYVLTTGINIKVPAAEAGRKQAREIEELLVEPPELSEPIAAALAGGADIPTLLKLIDQERQQIQSAYTVQLQAFETAHAGAVISAQAANQPVPPKGAPPPPPDISIVAKSSIQVWPSDFHAYEAAKCKWFLSSDACRTQLSIGIPDTLKPGEMVKNTAGVLNVVLHWEAHEEAAKLQPAPMMGPLPAVGSPPKLPPQPAAA